METLLLALSPFIVNVIMSGVKKLPPLTSLTSGWRAAVLRGLAYLFALVGVIAHSWLDGSVLEPSVVENIVNAFLVFASSQGTFFLFSGKGKN